MDKKPEEMDRVHFYGPPTKKKRKKTLPLHRWGYTHTDSTRVSLSPSSMFQTDKKWLLRGVWWWYSVEGVVGEEGKKDKKKCTHKNVCRRGRGGAGMPLNPPLSLTWDKIMKI